MPRFNFRTSDFTRVGDLSTAVMKVRGYTVTANYYHTKYGYLTLTLTKGESEIGWANEFCPTLKAAIKAINAVTLYGVTTGYVNHGIWDLDTGEEFMHITKAQKVRNKAAEKRYFEERGFTVQIRFTRKWH